MKNDPKKNAQKNDQKNAPGDAPLDPASSESESKAKRRPGRDPEMQSAPGDVHGDVTVVDVEVKTSHSADATNSRSDSTDESYQYKGDEKSDEQTTEPKVELNFKGSEVLRAKFPKPFEVAEKVASDWIHDGRFEGLPLGHPLAQYFAAKGLRRAKELEKKVMESPTTEKVFTQAFAWGLKAQEIIKQASAKIKK